MKALFWHLLGGTFVQLIIGQGPTEYKFHHHFEVKCAYRQEWLQGAILSQVQSKAL